MNDAFLMSVLHRPAHVAEQLQPLAHRQLLVVAVFGDRLAFDEFHHEVRPAAVDRAGIEHPGDVRVFHQRQRLPFRLKTDQHLPRIHAGLDHLDSNPAVDRLLLLGHPDRPHPPFADLLEQFVRADDGACGFGRWLKQCGFRRNRGRRRIVQAFVRGEESVDVGSQLRIVAAGLVEVRGPVRRRGQPNRVQEDRLFKGVFGHDRASHGTAFAPAPEVSAKSAVET